jgi:hypothetical protein
VAFKKIPSIIFFVRHCHNFPLCQRILINVTTCQKRQINFKEFKRFGAFKGLVEQKNVVFNWFLCKLGFFWHEWASLKRE